MQSKTINIDIIILSYSKNDELKALTQQTIDTLLLSERPEKLHFEILVIESEKKISPFQFKGSKTIYPKEPFGFHRYLNIGINQSNNEYICLCNNDLIFGDNWASELIKYFDYYPQLMSANPICPNFEPTKKIINSKNMVWANKNNIFEGVLTGWCIFVRRSIFDKIGLLDERFEFWYADRDYGKTLLKHGVKHALIPSAIVEHLGSKSHKAINENVYNHYTLTQHQIFLNKWNKNIFRKIKIWLKTKINIK